MHFGQQFSSWSRYHQLPTTLKNPQQLSATLNSSSPKLLSSTVESPLQLQATLHHSSQPPESLCANLTSPSTRVPKTYTLNLGGMRSKA